MVTESRVKQKSDQLVEQLCILIDRLGITHIYSYDDHWDQFYSKELEQKENEKLKVTLDEFFTTYFIEPDDKEKKIISNNGFDTLEELVNSEISALNSLINECMSKIKLKRENKVLETLNVLFSSLEAKAINIERKSIQFCTDDVTEDVPGKILYLLDMNMEDTAGKSDVVIESIREIKKVRPSNNDIIVVYSYEKLSYYESHEAKADYVNKYLAENNIVELQHETEKYLFLHQLWALSKTPRLDELSNNLVSTLMNAAFGYSLHDYLKNKLISTEKAFVELMKINETTFDFLYKDAFVEGELFVDILERTQKSLLNKVETENANSPEFNRVLNNMSAIATIKNSRILNEIVTKGIHKFRVETKTQKSDTGVYQGISEYGLLQYSVNQNFRDIMTGDIFKIKLQNDSSYKYGILVTPDCDLLIRFGKDHNEISRKVSSGTLLLFPAVLLEATEGKEKIKDGKGIWPIKDEDKYILIDTSAKAIVLNVDMKILDLCSLNTEGKALMNADQSLFNIYKTHYFNKYYETELFPWTNEIQQIKNYIPNNISLIKQAAVAELEEDMHKLEEDSVLQELENNLNINELLSVFIRLKYHVNFDIDSKMFDIIRIGRLEMQRTLQLVQTYQNNTSRIGVPTNPLAQ